MVVPDYNGVHADHATSSSSLHSLFMNLNMSSTLALLAFGVSITALITSVSQCLWRKTWCFWPFVIAALSQTLGTFASFYYHESDQHAAFFGNMVGSSIAPPFIFFAACTTFYRIEQYISVTNTGKPITGSNIRTYVAIAGLVSSLIPLTMALMCFQKFLGSTPMMGIKDAQMRLVYFERGTLIMRCAYGAQVLSMLSLSVPVIRKLCLDKSYVAIAKDKTSQRFITNVNGVVVVSLFWALQRLIAFNDIGTYRLGLSGSDSFVFVRDTFPVLVCMVVFCWTNPGAYLPKEYTGFTRAILDTQPKRHGSDLKTIDETMA